MKPGFKKKLKKNFFSLFYFILFTWPESKDRGQKQAEPSRADRHEEPVTARNGSESDSLSVAVLI